MADIPLDAANAAGALRETMFVVLKLAGPPLLAAMVVGLVVSLVQAVTQVNEATLSFVPKALLVGFVLAATGSFMQGALTDYTRSLFDRVVAAGAP